MPSDAESRSSYRAFIGARLQLAREYRGLTQVALGKMAATSGPSVSYCENGFHKNPSHDLVAAFAEVLGFTTAFFYKPIADDFLEEECSFRHRRSTPERAKKKIRAHATLLGEVLHHLRQSMRLPVYNVPKLERSPELAAEECRRAWKIDCDAPLLTIVRALEGAGVVVVIHFGDTAKVDAFSRRGPVSVIFLNRSIPSTSRWIFDVAHEAGHLAMHHNVTTGCVDTEKEADQFASAFLMPRRAFSREFRAAPFTWSHVFQLKRRWQVSAAAIVRRAYDIGLIGAVQYRRSFQYMSAHGWSKQEPYEPEFQEPELLNSALQLAHAQAGETLDSLSQSLGYLPSSLQEILGATLPRTQGASRVMEFHKGQKEARKDEGPAVTSCEASAVSRTDRPAHTRWSEDAGNLTLTRHSGSNRRGQDGPRPMAGRKTGDVHVSRNPESSARPWKVTQDGQKVSTHETQSNAIDRGRTEARRDGVDLVTHGRDGKIRSKDSYGNDPNPPRDTEH